jgi:hypothetical protein
MESEHYDRVYKMYPLDAALCHKNPFHILTPYLVHFNITPPPPVHKQFSQVTSTFKVFRIKVCTHFSFLHDYFILHAFSPRN